MAQCRLGLLQPVQDTLGHVPAHKRMRSATLRQPPPRGSHATHLLNGRCSDSRSCFVVWADGSCSGSAFTLSFSAPEAPPAVVDDGCGAADAGAMADGSG
jgi:hypothetical protein